MIRRFLAEMGGSFAVEMLTVDDESDKMHVFICLVPLFSDPAIYIPRIFLSFSGTAFSATPYLSPQKSKYVARHV